MGLLIEIILVMKLTPDEASSKSWTLGVVSAMMIAVGYPGELIVEGDMTTRWICWAFSMVCFLFIVYTLLIGLCTYPVVYVFPMMGISGAQAVVAIQVGYCASDIISKCGLGLMIYGITKAKSDLEKSNALLP